MLLYKRLRIERMLSPYTNPFYPITEISQIRMETKTEKARNTRNIEKPELASKLHVNIDSIKFKDKRAPKEEEWTEVKCGVKYIPPRYDIKATPSDYYDVLREIEKEE